MANLHKIKVIMTASLLTACTSIPTGPSIMALPGSTKSFDLFRNDDNQCRQFADQQINSSSPENSSEQINQQRYDTSYIQCMYGRDHRVPVYGKFTDDSTIVNTGNHNNIIPPPPPGKPPPPPPK